MTTHPLLSGRQQLLVLGLAVVLVPLGVGMKPLHHPNRITAVVTQPPCTPPPTNQPWGTPADLLAKTNGSFQLSWAKLDQHFRSLTLTRQLGEQHHLLIPVDRKAGRVYASILPYQGTGDLCKEAFKGGVVVAKIEADGDYPQLGLVRGDNYYVVFQVGRRFHPIVVNPTTRKELKRFVYKTHGAVAGGYERSAFTRAAYECAVILKLKACFVDSPTARISRSPGGPGGGLLFTRLFGWLFRQGGESQPWAACPQSGCCCGGTNCHPDT